jgi:hypothetical protein
LFQVQLELEEESESEDINSFIDIPRLTGDIGQGLFQPPGTQGMIVAQSSLLRQY